MVHSKRSEREAAGEHFRNLFVKNIPLEFTAKDLEAIFQPFGKIESCEKRVNDNEHTDIGFVMFETHE